ncbi:hypothetical protein SAMN05661096_04039 [Marivirga sericea]|uniref:Uncharacterized protein n=1 Tax=Marivirga sericea TaxID=1028 RepID=A0A1X7LIE2_9BACT|nr:DUF6607 family protein [Marivirga sericea]SMG53032.1 hypothetical protein SAMN05661096_04039 [Marivirga sericea]
MKKVSLILMLAVFVMSAQAQKKKKADDVKAIMDMCGCYEVEFNFAETFSPVEDYEFHDNYRSGALEYVFPVEESKDKIVLQHLLVIGDTMIIKHWRQDWLYENTDLYTFQKDNTWKYQELAKNDVKGQWTQKVYQVDDGPRYEGSATWVHVDGKSYWEAKSDAPLPRREFSKRDDYNVMARENRHEITEYGWLHEQDNQKVLRQDGDDKVLASEKGWNTYTKMDDDKCKVAVEWWAKNQAYWADVRAVWDELFASKSTVKIKKKVDNKVLFMPLFELQDKLLGADYDSEKAQDEIKAVIQKYLNSEQRLSLN